MTDFDPIIDTCTLGHKFAKLDDHPMRDGIPCCPTCMAMGLDVLREEKKQLLLELQFKYKPKRGKTKERESYTGPLGEIILDTELNMIYIQDGVTQGGIFGTRASDIAISPDGTVYDQVTYWTMRTQYMNELNRRLKETSTLTVYDSDLDLFYDRLVALQNYIKENDISQTNTPIGFSFMASGKILVKFSLSDPVCYGTPGEVIQHLTNAIKELS